MAMLLITILVVIPAAVGVMLIWGSRRRGAPYPTCGKCAYDLSGSIGATTRCPECGSAFAEVGILPPRGRRKPALLWSGVGLVAVAMTLCVAMVASVLAMRAAEAARAQAAMQQRLLQLQLQQPPAMTQPFPTDAASEGENTPAGDADSP